MILNVLCEVNYLLKAYFKTCIVHMFTFLPSKVQCVTVQSILFSCIYHPAVGHNKKRKLATIEHILTHSYHKTLISCVQTAMTNATTALHKSLII